MIAYDNNRRKVLGTVALELTIGPMNKKIRISSAKHSFVFQHAPWATMDP